MKKLFSYVALFLSIGATLLSCGCQDARNIDDEAHVLALGIDTGKERRFKFSVQIPSQTASTATKGGFMIHSAEADSIYEAIDLINTSLPWRLNFTHLNLIAFSEELARQGYIEEFMRPSPRHLGFRTTCSVIITRDNASAFLDGMHGQNDINLAKQQRTWVLEPMKSALFPECTYMNLAESLTSPIYCALLPVGAVNINAEAEQKQKNETEETFSHRPEAPRWGVGEAVSEPPSERTELVAGETIRESVNTSEIMGSAILEHGKLVAELDASQTLVMMLARNQFNQGWYFYSDEGHSVADLKLARPRRVTVISQNPLKIRIEVFLKGDIEIGLGTDVFKDENRIARIESAVTQSIHGEMERLFGQCRELGVDAFELGKGVILNFATNKEWQSYNWIEKYKASELEISVDFRLNRYNVSNESAQTGKETKPLEGANQGSTTNEGKNEMPGGGASKDNIGGMEGGR